MMSNERICYNSCMKYEQPDAPEQVPNEEGVIRALRELGCDNPTSEKLLAKLVDAYEAEAASDNTSLASIRAANKVAAIFLKAGYFDDVLESLEENLSAAMSEKDQGLDVYREVIGLIDAATKREMSFTE